MYKVMDTNMYIFVLILLFLSSIKECLTKVNEVFRYKRLTEEDPLDKRIIHATYEINMSDLQNWVKYSIQFFFLCLEEVKKL
jgi:hypothetical protein